MSHENKDLVKVSNHINAADIISKMTDRNETCYIMSREHGYTVRLVTVPSVYIGYIGNPRYSMQCVVIVEGAEGSATEGQCMNLTLWTDDKGNDEQWILIEFHEPKPYTPCNIDGFKTQGQALHIDDLKVGMLVASNAHKLNKIDNNLIQIATVIEVMSPPTKTRKVRAGGLSNHEFYGKIVAKDDRYSDYAPSAKEEKFTIQPDHSGVDTFWIVVEAESPEAITAETYHKARASGRRIVVAAACKYGSTIVVCNRHHSLPMNILLQDHPNLKGDVLKDKREQGFIDQKGVYMNRFEALEVARRAGQLYGMVKTSPVDRLFSEDIYL